MDNSQEVMSNGWQEGESSVGLIVDEALADATVRSEETDPEAKPVDHDALDKGKVL